MQIDEDAGTAGCRETRRARMTTAATAALVLTCGLANSAGAKERPSPKHDEPAKTTGCEVLGEGYVKEPGSDTCVRISGSARAEGAVVFGR